MLRSLEEKVDPKHAALLLVDVQNDACHSDGAMARSGLDVSQIREVVPRLVEFLSRARKENLTIVFIRTIYSEWTESEVRAEKRRFTVGREGTWGAEFYGVVPQLGECVVTKYRYSAFVGTNLDLILRSKGIRTLIMTGFTTRGCVESTARDGFFKDYYIVFLKDLTAAVRPEHHETTLRNIEDLFGVVTTSEEVMAAWAKMRHGVQ